MTTDLTSLDRLHDIIAPSPAPRWPLAPGWDWVIGFILLLLLVLIFRLLLHWLGNCYRREALTELAQQEANLTDTNRRADAITAIADLLKRTALSIFPRESVASLTGPAWFAFLNRTRGRARPFPADAGEWLERVAYESNAAQALDDWQVRAIAAFARDWITHHRATEITGGNSP